MANSVRADLSAVVSPGYTFASGERADTSKLNRLGNPTITITGTVGGTNANVANNSINGAMLVNGLPGSNLTWDASSPRSLVISNTGVGAQQISSAIAGNGLTGGSGSALSINYDTNTITITNDVMTLNLTTFSNLVNTLASSNAIYQVTNGPLSLKAWAKFSGTATGTNTPTAGWNVSNVVRHATGLYTVNFSNAIVDADYAVTLTTLVVPGTDYALVGQVRTQATTSVSIETIRGQTDGDTDATSVYLQIVR